MAEQPDDLKKLVTLTSDLGYPVDIRTKAIKSMGKIGSHDALLALLALAANEQLTRGERELALKQARGIVKASY